MINIVETMKLSVYLNSHYSYYQVKEESESNKPGEIAYNFKESFKDKVFQSPVIVLRSLKTETNAIDIHYERLSAEAKKYSEDLYNVVKKGPKLSPEQLEIVDKLEEKRNILVAFICSIEDGLCYILEFLLTHYSEDDLGFVYMNKFKNFLPNNYYLADLLKLENQSIWNLNKELNKFNEMNEKLDHWKRKFYDGFFRDQRYENLDGTITTYRKSVHSKSNIIDLIGKKFNCSNFYSPASIPAEIYKLHFDTGLQCPKFTFWFLKFNAKVWNEDYFIYDFQDKLNSEIAIEFIESDLKEIEDLEEKATRKLLNKEIDLYLPTKSNSQDYFRELKRIQSNYYLTRVLEFPHLKGSNSTVHIFARHIFFKSYLLTLLDKLKPELKINIKPNQKFLNIFINIIKNLSRKPVNFKLEDDYRSHFYHIFGSYEGVHVSAEEISREGRTDLMLKGELGTQIVEFKIWGRNDFRKIIHQTTDYLSDFESVAFVLMANPSRNKRIDDEYLDILKNKESGLIGDVVTHNIEETNYKYYETKHEVGIKQKHLFHFIFNTIQ